MIMTFITGNLTADPAVRTVNGNKTVCSFTVASNKVVGGEKKTTYINVTTWEGRAETCAKYLQKGSKVCVVGEDLHPHAYNKKDGTVAATLELTAQSVEFLSSKNETASAPISKPEQMVVVENDDDLPF